MTVPASFLATVRATVGKDLVALWTSPVPWVSGAVFHLALGVLSVDTMQARQQAVFQPVVPIAGFLLLVAVPVLAMRSLADERRTGTLDVLLAVPVRPLALVVGKWLALVATVVAVASPVALHAVLLAWWGSPDAGPIIAGALGLVLLAAMASSVGLFTSSLTSSQAVAALSASFVLLLGWFLRPSTASVALRTTTARLSINERLRSFAAGAIDLGDVGFFVGLAAAGVLAAAAVVALGRGRGTARSARDGAVLAAVAVVALVGQWQLDERGRLFDLTEESSLSLTAETEDVLDAVDDTVEITAFLRDDQPGRDAAAALLDRYEDASRRIVARVVDPADAPGELRRLGVDPASPGVALEAADGAIEVVPAAIESDITLGLARLTRGELPVLCLTRGHGELDPDERGVVGFASAASLLVDNGYDVRGIDLLTGDVPDACGAVLVAGPASSFGDVDDPGSGAARLAAHLDAGGRVGLFLETGFTTGLESLARDRGIDVLGGIVAEGEADSVFAGDPTAPLIRRYSSGSPIVRNLPPTFFVTAGGLEVVEDAPGVVVRLADSSPASLLIADVDGDESTAVPGPITVAAASEIAANVDQVPVRSRLVVVADVDVFGNAFVDEAANGRFLVQLVDWLTVDDDLVSVSSNLAEPRPLALTGARRDYARTLTAMIVPGLFLVAGGLVWAIRRRR